MIILKVRSTACEVASSLGALLPSAGICDLLFDILALDSSPSSGWAPAAGKTTGCGALLRTAGDRCVLSCATSYLNRSLEVRGEVLQFLENGLNDERASMKVTVCRLVSFQRYNSY